MLWASNFSMTSTHIGMYSLVLPTTIFCTWYLQDVHEYEYRNKFHLIMMIRLRFSGQSLHSNRSYDVNHPFTDVPKLLLRCQTSSGISSYVINSYIVYDVLINDT